MSIIITHAGGTITPTAVEGFQSDRASGNIAQPVPGLAAPDYSLRPASLRTGTLTLVFGNTGAASLALNPEGYVVALAPTDAPEAASRAAELAHALPRVFTITASPVGSLLLMRYVVREGGVISRSINPSTGSWRVAIDFQEVT